MFVRNIAEENAPADTALKNVENYINQIQDNNLAISAVAPSLHYETLRKKIEDDIKEFWFFISSQLTTLKNDNEKVFPNLKKTIDKILGTALEHKL